MVLVIEKGGVLAAGIVLPILGFVAVLLRIFGRVQSKLGIGIDDWCVIAAWVLMTGCGAIFIAGYATETIGGHAHNSNKQELFFGLPPSQVILEKLEYSFNIIVVWSLAFTKLSICFFYRRIFRGRAFDIASWVAIGCVLIWAVTFIISILADCGTHPWGWWSDMSDMIKYCPHGFVVGLTYSILDVITDVYIMILPLPAIFALQMEFSRKLSLFSIFMVGALVVACGIARAYYYFFFLPPAHGFTRTLDNFAVVTVLCFWAMIESGVAVIVACLPTLRLVLKQLVFFEKAYSYVSHLLSGSSHSHSRSRSWISEPQRRRDEHSWTHNGGITKRFGYEVEYGSPTNPRLDKSTWYGKSVSSDGSRV